MLMRQPTIRPQAAMAVRDVGTISTAYRIAGGSLSAGRTHGALLEKTRSHRHANHSLVSPHGRGYTLGADGGR